jgi:hypothetical protein
MNQMNLAQNRDKLEALVKNKKSKAIPVTSRGGL